MTAAPASADVLGQLGKAVPAYSDGLDALADWMERTALSSKSDDASFEELRSALRSAGYVEEIKELASDDEAVDRGGSKLEGIAEAVMALLSGRADSCKPQNYPFEVTKDRIIAKQNAADTVYAYLLALSEKWPGPANSVESPIKDFEELSAKAAANYLGTDSFIVFGFPRRYEKKGFEDALVHLCAQLGEPIQAKSRAKALEIHNQKDGNLDVVVWRSFADARPGKLVCFGQCTTGHNLRIGSKDTQLQVEKFIKLWIDGHFVIDPIRALFTPEQLGSRTYYEVSPANLVFDRCRLVEHLESVSATEIVSNFSRLQKALAVPQRSVRVQKRRKSTRRR